MKASQTINLLKTVNHHPAIIRTSKALQFAHLLLLTVTRSGFHFYLGAALCVLVLASTVEVWTAPAAASVARIVRDELENI